MAETSLRGTATVYQVPADKWNMNGSNLINSKVLLYQFDNDKENECGVFPDIERLKVKTNPTLENKFERNLLIFRCGNSGLEEWLLF